MKRCFLPLHSRKGEITLFTISNSRTIQRSQILWLSIVSFHMGRLRLIFITRSSRLGKERSVPHEAVKLVNYHHGDQAVYDVNCELSRTPTRTTRSCE